MQNFIFARFYIQLDAPISLIPWQFKIHLLLYKRDSFSSHKICNTALLCLLIFCVLFIHWSCLNKHQDCIYYFKWVIRHWHFDSMHCITLHLLYPFYIIIHIAQSILDITDTVLVLFLLVELNSLVLNI